jgi:elongation factor 1-alpha
MKDYDKTPEGKEHLSICIVGHVDAGKSTTTGHLLHKLGTMSEREREKLQKEADDMSMGSFAFAHFLDTQPDEKKRGITIKPTTKEFFTEKYHFTIIDCPGHKDFIKNMMIGASQADVVIVMVPAEVGGLEKAIADGSKDGGQTGQTRQHTELCYLRGIKQVIVCVNKMDDKSVKWGEDRFREVEENMRHMLKQAKYDPDYVPIIPISGLDGDNLTDPSDKCPWYKGWNAVLNKKDKKTGKVIENIGEWSGHTLYDALNNFAVPPPRFPDKPFRMPVGQVFQLPGKGFIVTGRIEQGTLQVDDVVSFTGGETKVKVVSVELHHRSVKSAKPGDNVGVNFRGITKENKPRPGDVGYIVGEKSDTTPPRIVESFTALVSVRHHSGELHARVDSEDKAKARGGFTPLVVVKTAKTPCELYKINWKMGKKSTGGAKMENSEYVEKNDNAEVVFKVKNPIRNPIYVEPFELCEGLARLTVMDSNNLIMLGKITSVTYKD